MGKVEGELARKAQQCGLTLIHHKGADYNVRTWDGGTIGPFKPAQLRTWLAGFSHGMHAHAPGCSCGRVACVHREAARDRGVKPLKAGKS